MDENIDDDLRNNMVIEACLSLDASTSATLCMRLNETTDPHGRSEGLL